MPRMLLLTLLVTLSGLLAGTDARSLSNVDVLSEEERLFLSSTLDSSLVAVTNTTATLQFDGGKSLFATNYVAFCVNATMPFDCGSTPANATGGVLGKSLVGKNNQVRVTVTGLVPDSKYNCYVKVTKKLGLDKCTDPVSVITTANPVPALRQFLLITESDGNTLKSCEILNSTGALGNCTNTTLTVPEDLTVVPSTVQRLVYVADGSTTGVTKCSYDLLGNIIGCTPASLNNGAFALSGPPLGISSTKEGLVTISVDVTNGEIVQCDITPISNDLTGCISLNGVFAKPTVDSAFGIDVPFLYVVEEGSGGNVVKCSVDSVGRIISSIPCITATTGSLPPSFPTSITYAGNFNGKNVFYITDQQSGGIVIKAEEDTQTGNLILSSGSSTSFPSVNSLSVDPSGKIAYVSQATTPSQVVKCNINQTTAQLENCVSQPVSTTNPGGMGFIPFTA